MNKALALEVARELKLSPEKVMAVCQSFHEGLNALIKDPANAKAGIHIENFLTLNLNKYKIINSLGRENPQNVEVKEQVLINLQKYKRNETKSKKRQTEQQNDNVGSHES